MQHPRPYSQGNGVEIIVEGAICGKVGLFDLSQEVAVNLEFTEYLTEVIKLYRKVFPTQWA